MSLYVGSFVDWSVVREEDYSFAVETNTESVEKGSKEETEYGIVYRTFDESSMYDAEDVSYSSNCSEVVYFYGATTVDAPCTDRRAGKDTIFEAIEGAFIDE